MNDVVAGAKHACVVVSSEQSATELFGDVLGLTSLGGDNEHIFTGIEGFVLHKCSVPQGPIARQGWTHNPVRLFPTAGDPRSIIGLNVPERELFTERIANSPIAMQLKSFSTYFSGIEEKPTALRDEDDQLWFEDRKIVRYLPISDRSRASRFYEMFLGTEPFSEDIDRYVVTDTFDICLVNATLPPDFANSSLYQQLSHFSVEVFDLRDLLSQSLNQLLKPFQMDDDGNRLDIQSSGADLSFGYDSIYLYDPDGSLWEFENSI
jgi:catechol 2,3-dioxygenase-like lactoylglutathione lyase family enzyme